MNKEIVYTIKNIVVYVFKYFDYNNDKTVVENAVAN